jgi:hypothetical protein
MEHEEYTDGPEEAPLDQSKAKYTDEEHRLYSVNTAASLVINGETDEKFLMCNAREIYLFVTKRDPTIDIIPAELTNVVVLTSFSKGDRHRKLPI